MKLMTSAERAAGGETEDLLSLCSLMAGGRLFGIDTRMIREVLGKGRLHKVPLARLTSAA